MYELVVGEHFDAAHFLRGYAGKCAHMHGHSWQVEVRVRGKKLDPIGMAADFSLLKKRLGQVTDGLDHCLLNDLDYFKISNPTAENIAFYLAERYKVLLADLPVTLFSVTVRESPRAAATYYPEESGNND